MGAGRFLERNLSSEEQCSGQRGGAMGGGMWSTIAGVVSALEDRVYSAPVQNEAPRRGLITYTGNEGIYRIHILSLIERLKENIPTSVRKKGT